MSDRDDPTALEPILEKLVQRRMEESLVLVEAALAAWRKGEHDIAVPHVEAVRHVARMGTLASRLAEAKKQGPARLLRDAFDLGLLDREKFVALCGVQPEAVEPEPPLDAEVDAASAAPPPKRLVVESLLRHGPVLLHVDARKDGVKVPSHLASEPALVLRVGYQLTPAIPDLTVDEDGVRATLTFRGVPCLCLLPWPSVFAVTNEAGEGVVYDQDVPPEAAQALGRGGSGPQGAETNAPEPRDSGSEGDGPGDDGPPSAGSEGSTDGPPPRTPSTRGRHLKLVR